MIVVFDVDDTLYDLASPFKKALDKNFPNIDIDFEQLFLRSRVHSDVVFHQSVNGEITMEEMYIYRISKAFEDFDVHIKAEQALAFQEDYAYFQQFIRLVPDIEVLLEELKKCNVLMGLITNGPLEHQTKKIKQLELSQWIDTDFHIVSGGIGWAKPDVNIFKHLEEKFKKISKNDDPIYYVGDSFESDIIGSWNAGWQPIWLNTRNKKPGLEADHPIYSDLVEVDSYNALKELVLGLI